MRGDLSRPRARARERRYPDGAALGRGFAWRSRPLPDGEFISPGSEEPGAISRPRALQNHRRASASPRARERRVTGEKRRTRLFSFTVHFHLVPDSNVRGGGNAREFPAKYSRTRARGRRARYERGTNRSRRSVRIGGV